MSTSADIPHPLPPLVIEIVASRFRALGEPMRIRMLDLLRDGEMTVGELAEALDTTQQNVSKHVGILQRAGIIGRRRDGMCTPYTIIDETVLDLCAIVCGGVRRDAEGITQAFDA